MILSRTRNSLSISRDALIKPQSMNVELAFSLLIMVISRNESRALLYCIIFSFLRWRMVIHGGIDGFSRAIVYLSFHNNNRASTAFEEFNGVVGTFGLPSRVRTDQGVENVDIAKHMLDHPDRGEGRGSHITGRSVCNQRIEELRDSGEMCIMHAHSSITGCSCLNYFSPNQVRQEW